MPWDVLPTGATLRTSNSGRGSGGPTRGIAPEAIGRFFALRRYRRHVLAQAGSVVAQ